MLERPRLGWFEIGQKQQCRFFVDVLVVYEYPV